MKHDTMKNHPGLSIYLILLWMGGLHQAVFAQSSGVETILEEINAFLHISDDLATSGQIAYDQIELIKEAGFEVVINLAVADEARNGLEGFLVTQQGLSYIHIPVSWQNPSQRDLQFFFDIMEANRGRKVYVHCFANMRVSAFVYLYRTLHEGVSEEEALADLKESWDPMETEQWAKFIETARREAESKSE
jgi:protein tyrosine phosphatase (PTP) superfamily phosphohydrolase (DUF442 family)